MYGIRGCLKDLFDVSREHANTRIDATSMPPSLNLVWGIRIGDLPMWYSSIWLPLWVFDYFGCMLVAFVTSPMGCAYPLQSY